MAFQNDCQFSSGAQSCPTLCEPMNHSTPGIPVHTTSRTSHKLMSIKSVMPSSHLILCHPLLLLPSIFPSIRVFSNKSTLCMRWRKYWSFSLSISPSNEYQDWSPLGWTGWISLHHSSKASVLQCSAFFIVQLSHSYMTTGKTIALTRWTFVGKVTSLLF